ncbi:MAG TPA: hypothetical protein VEO54_09760 [Thermoanaerobaculia bacterium]|nr:hypothetical protein [Thermoanaerobaculia bacterium]
MRGVFPRTAAAWLLIVVLIAPSATASQMDDASLWAEFTTWLEARIGVPNGVTEADFTLWLMSRIGIPGG